MAPELERGAELALDERPGLVRHVAVGADRTHARAVDVVDRALELGVHVVLHLVAADAELFGVGPGEARGPRHHQDRGKEQPDEQHAGAERDARASLAALLQVLPPLDDHGPLPLSGAIVRQRVRMYWMTFLIS